MDHERYIAIIQDQSRLLRAAAKKAGPNAAVPPCPGWIMADLIDHLAGVQMWCADTINNGKSEKRVPLDPTDDPVKRFSDATDKLVDALNNADPDAVCLALPNAPASSVAANDRSVGFWARRQACEATIHRCDGEIANGESPKIARENAVDVIDEWVHDGLSRLVLDESVNVSELAGDVHLHCTDMDGEWTFGWTDRGFAVIDEHRKADAALKGPASDVALWVYNRVRHDDVEVHGDADLIARWIMAGAL